MPTKRQLGKMVRDRRKRQEERRKSEQQTNCSAASPAFDADALTREWIGKKVESILSFTRASSRLDDYLANRGDGRSISDILELVSIRNATDLEFQEEYPEAAQLIKEWNQPKYKQAGSLSKACARIKLAENRAMAILADVLSYFDKLTSDDIIDMMRPLIVKAEAIRALSDSGVAQRFMQMYGYYPTPKSAVAVSILNQQNNSINAAGGGAVPSFAEEMEALKRAGSSSTVSTEPLQLEASSAIEMDELGVGAANVQIKEAVRVPVHPES